MATKKISALVALTAPAVGDLLVITDISEAADADKTKKITFANLVNLAAQVASLPTLTSNASTDLLIAVRSGVAYQMAQSVVVPTIKTTKTYRSTAQSISNGSWTAVSWTGVSFDTMTGWSAGSPTRITAPRGGYYMIGATICFDVDATGVRQLAIRTNNANLGDSVGVPSMSGIVTQLSISGVRHLDINDYIEVFVYQNCGSSLPISTNYYSYMWMHDIGP